MTIRPLSGLVLNYGRSLAWYQGRLNAQMGIPLGAEGQESDFKGKEAGRAKVCREQGEWERQMQEERAKPSREGQRENNKVSCQVSKDVRYGVKWGQQDH